MVVVGGTVVVVVDVVVVGGTVVVVVDVVVVVVVVGAGETVMVTEAVPVSPWLSVTVSVTV